MSIETTIVRNLLVAASLACAVSALMGCGSGTDPTGCTNGLCTDVDQSGAAREDGSTPQDMLLSDGVFVAVGYGGRRMRSLDKGITWIDDQALESNGGDDSKALRSVVWGDDQFVALGTRVMLSPDGQTWTDLGTSLLGNFVGASIWAENEYVAIGGYGLRDTSTDGKTWQHHMVDGYAAHAHDGLTYGDGRFVMTVDAGQRLWSDDGKTWTDCTGVATGTAELAFGNGVFVGIGGTSVVVSSGGMAFSDAATMPVKTSGLVFADGHFTALAGGHVYTSLDGTTWTDHLVSGISGGNLVYGGGVYLLFRGNTLQRSTDGLTWTTASTGTSNSIEWAAYGTP